MIDLLSLIGSDTKLKKVAGTNGGEYHGPCPFCGGRDRFVVQPAADRWSCRQCSPYWSDAPGYLMRRDGLSYPEARAALGESRPSTSTKRVNLERAPEEEPAALTDLAWQRCAEDFVGECIDHLHSEAGARARAYLRGRGLSDAVIVTHELGYNPAGRQATWGSISVWLPRGIVIPWGTTANGLTTYERIRFRLPASALSETKYIQVKGGANTIYLLDSVYLDSTVVLTEGEFDALALLANATTLRGHGLRAVATGGIFNGRTTAAIARLALAQRVLVAFDRESDLDKLERVERAAAWWLERLPGRAQRLLPTRHDITAMVVAGDGLQMWLERVL
jgi:hypothetical protein